MMTVAEKIKTYRLRKAWSQEQLAEVASLSVGTVQRTEKGQKPSLETLSAIASAFGVNHEVPVLTALCLSVHHSGD